MDLIEEGRGFEKAGKATNRTVSVLILPVCRAHSGLEDIVEG